MGQPPRSAKAATSACSRTGAKRGQGTPSAVRRSRMTSLSWAWSRAAEPGRQATPADSSARMCGPGTCSWSNVTTAHPAAKPRRSASEVCSPMRTSEDTRAAEACAESLSTRSGTPSAIAACWVMRANCPPPTIPTTGVPATGIASPSVTPDRVVGDQERQGGRVRSTIMPTRTKQRACEGKTCHATREKAADALWPLVRGRGARPSGLTVYRRPHCQGWQGWQGWHTHGAPPVSKAEVAGDEDALHLGGALSDLEDLRVPP